MRRFSTYLLFVYVFASLLMLSCRTKKEVSKSHPTEIPTLQSFHIEKDLKKTLNQWLGAPYKYGGNSKKGVDCSGFVCAVYLEVYNTKLPRTSKDMYIFSEHIKLKDLREGDLIFFNYTGKGVSHVGIYLENNKFIHASTTKGVIVGDLNNEFTRKKIVGTGRVKKK